MAERVPATLLAPLADLGRWLEAIRTQAVIVGGVAVSFLGRPRFTQDIDVLAILSEQEWKSAVAAAPTYGIVPRIENPLDFARRARVLLLRHTDSAMDIDVILGGLSFEQSAVENGRIYKVSGVSVRLPRVEDLLIMKAVAHRPQDLQDIEGLLDAHPDANVDAVRQWVREFATVTSMSDLIEDFEKLLARRKASR
ncbi:MAG: nucleotidyl transferase AbiEii/AbiGii toxin family protein [Gammaproteobacteria bacterium]